MSEPLTLREAVARTERFLADRGVVQARREAQRLVQHALELEDIALYRDLDEVVDEDRLAALRPLVARRGRREPLAWILGSVGFHDIELAVGPGVLVPRPDTERLVEAALAWLPGAGEFFVADVGCGSGAVGLAIAHARPGVKLYATDLSPQAIATTKANVEALGLTDRVGVLQGHLLDPIPPRRPIDLVVSNPPYLAEGAMAGLEPEVRDHEPRLALVAGRDGLDVYRRLVPQAAQRARIGVAVEIGFDQGPAVADIFRRAGLLDVAVLQDLGRRDRVVVGRVQASNLAVPRPKRRAGQGDPVVELEPDPVLARLQAAGSDPVQESPAGAVGDVEPPVEVEREIVPEPPAPAAAPAVDEHGKPLPVFERD